MSVIKNSSSRIIDKKLSNNYCVIRLEAQEIASKAQPGQFVMIRTTSQTYPLLRRPFSIHDVNGNEIEIFFQKIGLGTNLLSQKKINDSVDVLGPLGKGFHLDAKRKEVAIIGGGKGIAPLYFLARRLLSLEISPQIFYGGKSTSDLCLKNKFEEKGIDIFCSTEDGSLGFKGLITEMFEHEFESSNPEQIYSCGPELMMKKIAQWAMKRKINAEFSLESVMGCGFGACWGCVRKIKKNGEYGLHKICEEGPVFYADEIVWQEN